MSTDRNERPQPANPLYAALPVPPRTHVPSGTLKFAGPTGALPTTRWQAVVARLAGFNVALFMTLAGCAAHTEIPPVRFKADPVVWKVNDRVNTPEKPEELGFWAMLYQFDQYISEPLDEFFSVREYTRAKNTNALDEVPNSTWFQNRLGQRNVTVDEIRRGPDTDDGPVKPWTIIGMKVGGAQLGFSMKDQRGKRYLIKFDRKGFSEYETGAHMIVQRAMWTLGYNVAEDRVVYFTPDELIVAKDANTKDGLGNKQPLSREEVMSKLAGADVGPDGRIRALVTKFVSGVPLGGFHQLGTRDGDPNDVIPHEYRREVRALKMFYSWLQSTDHKEDNTLDMWVADPKNENHKYVKHYLIDFGFSLGVNSFLKKLEGDGHIHNLDLKTVVISALTLGLYKHPFEGQRGPKWVGVGDFDIEHYRPDAYRGRHPYMAFNHTDSFDMFWGAKLLAQLRPEHVRAIVEQAAFTDKRATAYMEKTLLGRARKAARYWFQRVTPLDKFAVNGNKLCFTDLAVSAKLLNSATKYQARSFSKSGAATGWRGSARLGTNGRACINVPPKAPYEIVQVATKHGTRWMPPVYVHLGNVGGNRAVIGLWRTDDGR